MPASAPPPMLRWRLSSVARQCCSILRSRRHAIRSRWPRACALPSKPAGWPALPGAFPSLPMRRRRARNSASSARSGAYPWLGAPLMKLPDPPLLLITDRHQARLPLVDVVRAALAAGCRWVSMREKDLSEKDQIALALTLLPMARQHGACLTLHGPAALAKACGSDGVHLPAGTNPAASRALLGPERLIGVSLHTVTEAEAIDPDVVDYAIAGPAFETPSKPGYGPEIGRKGLAEIARAAPVPEPPARSRPVPCGRSRGHSQACSASRRRDRQWHSRPHQDRSPRPRSRCGARRR